MTSRVSASVLQGSQPARGPSCSPGESPLFEQVYREHFQLVWRTLRRLGVPPAHLEDAAQDVFVVVHRQLPGFERRSTLKTWIFGITTRVASDWSRRATRRPTVALPSALPANTAGPWDRAVRAEAIVVLDQLLGEMEPDKRSVFVLAELEELRVSEIAAALHENVNTVKSRLQAARRLFDAALRRHHARDRWRQP